jgi:hypothetical protein
LFPTQLWELLYTYNVIKQCTEKRNNFIAGSSTCSTKELSIHLTMILSAVKEGQQKYMLCTTYTNFWSIIFPLEVRCLTPLSKIFQLLLLWRKLEYPHKSTDLSQVTDKLYHIMFYWVHPLSLRSKKRKLINSDNHKFHKYQ